MTRDHHVSKKRLDSILVDRALVPSREQAGRVILAGLVTVNGLIVDKRAKLIDEAAAIEVADRSSSFVSRAGDKLAAAIEAFHVPCQGLISMDIGASTGGFTDCLLRHGVKRVYAIDVGYGQLDWGLRNDSRVVVLERCNIRYLPVETIPEPIALVVIDVSFISLKLVLPCVVKFLSAQAIVIALVKPQFEAGRKQVGRGGIIRDDTVRQEVIDSVRSIAEALGFCCLGHLDSPVKGKSGNREMLLGLRWGPESDLR